MTKAGSERKLTPASTRIALFIIAAFLMFAGPTYLIYLTQRVNLPYLISVFSGLIAFFVGVLLFLRLAKKQAKLGASE